MYVCVCYCNMLFFVEEYERQARLGITRSYSLDGRQEERQRGGTGCEFDASRSQSCPDDTSVKTVPSLHTANDPAAVPYPVSVSEIVPSLVQPARGLSDTGPADSRRPVTESGVIEQNNTYLQDIRISLAVSQREPVSDDMPDIDCVTAAVEADGPDTVTPSFKRSPTCANSASDSGHVEQDGTVSPLISSVKSVTVSGGRRIPVVSHDASKTSITLRNYQTELAELGCQGSNCIICAPTGSGKTFTAGYICKTRRDFAIAERRRFKCLFVVCIRNLIRQQKEALSHIMPESGVVCGVDDSLLLSEYFQQYDVVVATAQV